MLESTVIPLELYFPHRNYIPALGLYLGIGYFLFELTQRRPKLSPVIYGAGSCYVLLLLFVLVSTTSLWGKPAMAAALWAEQKPPSLRAGLYLHELYSETVSAAEADRVNDRLLTFFPDEPLLAIQGLELCTDDASVYRDKLEKASQSLNAATMITANISRALQKVAAAASASRCPHLGTEEVESLIAAARHNMSRSFATAGKSKLTLCGSTTGQPAG